jgi:hypothetical protein
MIRYPETPNEEVPGMAVKTRKGPRLDPFTRVDDQLGPLAEFVISLEDEVPYHEAVIEYQENWCEHPATSPKWEVISTNYQPLANLYEHVVRCSECGKVKYKNGRGRRTQ